MSLYSYNGAWSAPRPREERAGRERRISLTFDDGPDPVWTPQVLEALRQTGARATFFVITPLARQNPHLVAEIIREGHEVGLHCFRHVRHTELSHHEVTSDARTGLADLGFLGVRPRLWRTPWGILAPWTYPVAEEFGLRLASWTADTHDWRGDTAAGMLGKVLPLLVPGAVVLMHDGLGPGARRSGCEQTVFLVRDLLEHARAADLEPVPLGELTEFSSAAFEETRT